MGKRQTGFSKETLKTIGKHFAALVDYAKDKENLTAKQVYKQIFGDDDISNIEDKISKMKRGESITAYDVMKIQAWKNLSLDWLVLGKGNPPPELQETQEAGSSDEWAASNTVRGFLSSLMCLSLAEYTHNMDIEIHGHDYMYHDVNISFSLVPIVEEDGHSCFQYHCDTVTSLAIGLRDFSQLHLSEIPTDTEIIYDAKKERLKQICNSVPIERSLNIYDYEYSLSDIEHFIEIHDPWEDPPLDIPLIKKY